MFFKKDKIEKIKARQILDSRGTPTLEVSVYSSSGIEGRASVPSGASTGKKEAVELRDNSEEYFGKGVRQAVENVKTEINRSLRDQPLGEQKQIDKIMLDLDGREDRGRLGGNSLIGVSMAYARVSAKSSGIPLYEYLRNISGSDLQATDLPIPMFNLINGGLHAYNGLDIQEYLFISQADSFDKAVRMGAEVYHSLGQILREKGLYGGVGDEGGEAPKLTSNTQPFELITEAADKVGYKLGQDFGMGIDAAANSFLLEKDGEFKYRLQLEDKVVSSQDMIEIYKEWVDKYKLISIEDGLAEDDKEGWQNMTKALSHKVHVAGGNVEIIGDDLFVTNAKRLMGGIENSLATAVIIKPNQVGTVTETVETVKIAKQHKFTCIASHRSGDTCDSFISDIAVGLGCEYIKAGAPARGERVEKYNRLLEIEEMVGN